MQASARWHFFSNICRRHPSIASRGMLILNLYICLLDRTTWHHILRTAPSSKKQCGKLLPQMLSSGAMILCIMEFLVGPFMHDTSSSMISP